MKKVYTLLISIFVIMSLVACSSSKLSEDYSDDQVINKGKEVIEVINTLDYSAINNVLREDLRGDLTSDKLKEGWDSSLTKAGNFIEYTSTSTASQKSKSTGDDYAVAIINCKYENSNLVYTILMDKNMDIVGMYLK